LSCRNSPRLQTLAELLEWRKSLPGWEWRPTWDYLDELRRVLHWGRADALGHQVDELLRTSNDLQIVPARAFFDYRLDKQPAGNHGQLSDYLSFPKWQNLQFSSNTCAAWQAALEAEELKAPRAPTAAPPTRSAPTALPLTTTPYASPAARRRGKGGRRPGSGKIDDTEFLVRMLGLLAAGDAVSVHAAAKLVAADATGASKGANILRLHRKFSTEYGLAPPPGKTWRDVQGESPTN
jgi:hypothetical protein